MLNIGGGEIALILVVALLVLGPRRLPELARGIGKFMREFRRQTDEVRSTLESEFYKMDQDVSRDLPPVSPFGMPVARMGSPVPRSAPLPAGTAMHSGPVPASAPEAASAAAVEHHAGAPAVAPAVDDDAVVAALSPDAHGHGAFAQGLAKPASSETSAPPAAPSGEQKS